MITMKFILIIILSLCGCTSERKLSPQELTILEDWDFDKDIEHVFRTQPYSNLKPMIDKINESSQLTLFKGLPHQGYPKKLQSALSKGLHDYRFDFPFYSKPVSCDKTQLLKFIKRKDIFTYWGGFKNCGGFHPDYSMVWKTDNSEIEIHVCFGCKEIKTYSQGKSSYCDISGEHYHTLEKLLKER